MLFRTRRIVAALSAVLLITGTMLPSAAAATNADTYVDNSGSMMNDSSSHPLLDLLLLRPLGLVTFLAGSVLFIVPVLPLVVITRPTDIGKPFEALVIRPARYVWVDPLGAH